MRGAEDLRPDTRVPEAEPSPPARRRLLAKWAFKLTGMVAASAVLVPTVAYEIDIDEMRAMMSDTHPSITELTNVPETQLAPLPVPRGVYETLDAGQRDYIDTLRLIGGMATINFSGFGRTTMPESEKTYAPFAKIGANWSMNYDPTGLDPSVMAQTINDAVAASPQPIYRVGFIGNSAGTAIETDVAAELARSHPNIAIPFIVMDSPAIDNRALRPKSRSDGNALLSTINLPGVKYSRFDRIGADMYLDWDRVHGIGSVG